MRYPVNSRLLFTFLMLLAFFKMDGTSIASADTINPGYSQSMEGGRGLLYMQSARTYGKGAFFIGVKGLAMQREYPVLWKKGYTKDNTTVIGLPVTVGLTDEVDITGALYFFNDGRRYTNNLFYGKPEGGLGASRLGIKIRFPFDPERSIQIAAKLGAMFDTSKRQIDGLDYRWTRKGTDIESSLLQTLDLGRYLSLHFEEGYVLSGSKIYDDQYVGAAGIDYHPTGRISIGIEANNRSFDGVSPQSVFQAGTDPAKYYYGAAGIGNPALIKERKLDRMKDFFVVVPSLSYRLSGFVTLDLGAVINVADQASPKERVQIAAGLTFGSIVTSLLDTDKDQVNDYIDKQPDTPRGYPVDRLGVALDSDGDSVPNGRDREKDTPPGALVDPNGVSHDTDSDGVPDGIDREPNTPKGAPVDQFGVALDSDGDGVPNNLDRQADTPPGYTVDKYGVALDTDGDGVPDGRDQEPNTPAGYPVDMVGVSLDTDGDGVPDGKDKELNTPKGSAVDQFGRALKEQERALVQEGFIRLNRVYFETGKAKLTVESYDALNGVAELLKKYPMLRIEIQGHTDASGSRPKNLQLSKLRAQAVLDYLLNHEPALRHENFTVVGYGPDKPIAPNNTLEGKQLNRRVEFVVLNKEELQKLFPKK